ncbi:sulfotransferase family protein [Rhodohalobacter mucosus]|uniref:Sulfotransferase family protein n=2 Tax=Rhodohalobacter mucosus TaxID=2079485 RepID=A0A316TXE1_9BACT|nr:sulfotransferase family protein [Rhodohalobacter mucosus]
MRISLWSGPRNISTALMYSFAQRSDTTVVDEPLYAHYLTTTDAHTYHPGAEEVIASQEPDGEKVVKQILFGAYETPVVFFKNMTHHLAGLDWEFLKKTKNLILTRDPADMLPSYTKQVEKPTMRDVGYEMHLELIRFLKKNSQPFHIIDSKAVLMNPESELTAVCDFLGIPFERGMLSWRAGPRPEDGVWAKYWYHNVHKSIGFQPYQPREEEIPLELKPLYIECRRAYEKILSHALNQ